MRAAICSGLYSLWDLAFVHLFYFFLLVFIFNRGRQVPSLFLVFCQTFFTRQACRRQARLVGQSHWHRKHLWLKTSPLLRCFQLLHWTEPLVKIVLCHYPPSDAARQRQAAEYRLEYSQAMEEWIESFMPSSGCDFWLVPVLVLWNGLARLGDRSGLKCSWKHLEVTWKQLEVKVIGKGGIVCSLFVQHLTPQGLDPLLGFLGTAFMLKAANLTVVLWECIKRQLVFWHAVYQYAS